MYWLPDWIYGIPLILVTVLGHCFALFAIGDALVIFIERNTKKAKLRVIVPAVVASVVFALIVLLVIEASIWAVAYLLLGALPNWPPALLYSLESMTTFGHASLSLEPRWQMLGALEALNGIVLVGLTTAFLYSILHEAIIYRRTGGSV